MHCWPRSTPPTSGAGDDRRPGARPRSSDKALTRLRRDRIGFVFQSFNLVPTLTAEENILLPLAIAGRKPDQEWFDDGDRRPSASRDRLGHRPNELSGGQQQRVAVRPRAGQPADDRVRRRADRQPRLAVRRRGARAPPRAASTSSGRPIVMVTHDPVAAGVHRPGRVPRRRPGRRRDARARRASRVLEQHGRGSTAAPPTSRGPDADAATPPEEPARPQGAAAAEHVRDRARRRVRRRHR